jgi:hypothetical protein
MLTETLKTKPNDLFLKGLNLSVTFGFLMKLSDDTLLRIYKSLLDDREKFHPDDWTQMAITWHCVTIDQILKCRGGENGDAS